MREVTPDWKPEDEAGRVAEQWRAENMPFSQEAMRKGVRVTEFCAECWAETPDGICSCADEELPSGREGFDGIVDRLMYEKGLDREEAELRAEAILAEDAA